MLDMRGGATSGKSFSEGCEGGLPDELEVDLSEAWVVRSAGSAVSAGCSTFDSLEIDGREDAGVSSVTGFTVDRKSGKTSQIRTMVS